ncbi:hypothetical protein JHK87_024411 [Glycine soja]|nr:hypothetical protein JHK87_024411 [Glycine soja]
MMLGQGPRQTTSNLGHMSKPSIQALIHGLNWLYYSIAMNYRKNELEEKTLFNLHKKKWTDGLTLWQFDTHSKTNEQTVQFSDLENGLISLVDYILIECQAAKRQKLEGGSLHKVGDVKQQLNFVHKAPKKWRFAFVLHGHPEYLQDSDFVSERFQVRQPIFFRVDFSFWLCMYKSKATNGTNLFRHIV